MWADESGLLCLILDEATIHFLLIFLSFLLTLIPILLNLPFTSCTAVTSARLHLIV